MYSLKDEVKAVVEVFITEELLFTALDVSNKVKETIPHARHKEVRDIVRDLFATDISVADWARTPINVVLADGTIVKALLYHPLSDSWNLDHKYDTQKRAQVGARPNVAPVPATVASDGTVTVTSNVVASTQLPLPQTNAAALWSSLFDTKPSLFPRK